MYYPATVKFHKKNMGEMQINFSAPVFESKDNGRKETRPGCLYLEIARPVPSDAGGDGDKIDWNNKIVVKLDGHDLAALEDAYVNDEYAEQGKTLIHHKPQGGGFSQVNITPAKEGTFQWYIAKSKGGQKQMATMYVSRAEMRRIMRLIDEALRIIDGWQLSAIATQVANIVMDNMGRVDESKEVLLEANRHIVREIRAVASKQPTSG